MARRGNFLDGDDNFREQNLRFVRNDLEDNINQYFGGGNGGRPNVTAPPRDFNVVQPNPGQSEFENRKEFFLQLGLSRGDAGSLAERSFCLEHFSLNYFRDKRHLLRKSRLRQSEADAKIVTEISDEVSTIERGKGNFGRNGRGRDRNFSNNGGRGNVGFGGGNNGGANSGFNEFIDRRAPSPPRNMDWNERKRGFPGDNGNDGQTLFRNERNIGDLNEFVQRRRQLEMNQGQDGFTNTGRRSPQPQQSSIHQFNDNRNAPNDFGQFGSGRDGSNFNNDDNNKFFSRRDNEFAKRDDRGFGGRPEFNDDFNCLGNNFNSNILNDGYQTNRGISNNVGGGSFGVGLGGNNFNSSNIGGGHYRDNNDNNNNVNRILNSLLGDYQASGPSGNIGGNFCGGNNFNESRGDNFNNVNLNIPNVRGDFGGGRSNLNAIGSRDVGGINALLPKPPNVRNDFNIVRDVTASAAFSRATPRSSDGGSGMIASLGGNGRGGNPLKANTTKASSGPVRGQSSTLGKRQAPPNTGPIGGRNGGNSAPPSKRHAPPSSGPIGGRYGGNTAPLGKRQAPPNTGPIGGRNNGNNAPPGKRQVPPNSGPLGGLSESISTPPAKRQVPPNTGPIVGRNNATSATSTKSQVPPKGVPTGDRMGGKSIPPANTQEPPNSGHVGGNQPANKRKPTNNANTVQGKSGPNSNQANKQTQPANKASNTLKKNVAVGNKSNSKNQLVRNNQRDNKFTTNNSRNPSQNNAHNNNNPNNNPGNNRNGNFGSNAGRSRGFWGSSDNQGEGSFGNNPGFGGNFGFNNDYGHNQGFDGPFIGNDGGNFNNQFGAGGFCIKSFKINSNEKYFINVCQTDKIPAPEDLTEEQLTEILQSETPSNYRIPMSISEPRTTKDKSNNTVDVCDIAINPLFFVKCEKSVLFKDFFLALIVEALSEKYNVQLSIEKTIILNNRKFIGTLVTHRVRNIDVKNVLNSYQSASEPDKRKLLQLEQATAAFGGGQSPLVKEIDEKELAMLQKLKVQAEREKKNALMTGAGEPEYKLRAKLRDEAVEEIQAELYLPKCISSHEITLDIGEDRILLESIKHGYVFDKFVNYRLNQERARAIFDKTNKMLQIRIPVSFAK